MSEHEPKHVDEAALEKILKQGELQNESFLREDYAHQRQKAFFVCSALVILSVGLIIIVGTLEQSFWRQWVGAISPAILAGGLAKRWTACPKCHKVPIHPANIIHIKQMKFPPNCPHCGFAFDAKQLESIDEDTSDGSV